MDNDVEATRETEQESEQTLKQTTVKEINIVREIIECLIIFAVAILFTWVIITFVGERTRVSGESMYNTLSDNDNLWVSKISYRLHDPDRFDIVVFPHMEDGEEVLFIKRIIGMPGETVRIDKDGSIYINDEYLDEDYGYEVIDPYSIGVAGDGVKLGDDEYFVMGDNRNKSLDSRFSEVGNIKRDDLVGKAVFRMWPLSSFGKIE